MATCAPQIDETNQTERVRALNDLARLGQNANARFVFTATLLATLTAHAPDPVANKIATVAAQRSLITAIRSLRRTRLRQLHAWRHQNPLENRRLRKRRNLQLRRRAS
mgnify:CR=1 FL=1